MHAASASQLPLKQIRSLCHRQSTLFREKHHAVSISRTKTTLVADHDTPEDARGDLSHATVLGDYVLKRLCWVITCCDVLCSFPRRFVPLCPGIQRLATCILPESTAGRLHRLLDKQPRTASTWNRYIGRRTAQPSKQERSKNSKYT